MNSWGYTREEYELIIGEMSYKKHLIVEGKTDKYFFKILLDEYSQKINSNIIEEINIDDIETMIQKNDEFQLLITGVVGNRRKIESIYKNIQNSSKYKNLVFFIDREFDDFSISLNQEIQDYIGKHKVDGSMIWSRGHSIENYLFDFSILRNPLKELSDIELFNEAIKLFENNFYQIIKLATAISITLKECKKIKELEEIIDWELICLENKNSITINIDDLQNRICERKKLSLEESEKIIHIYQQWLNKIDQENVDIDILRWLCHGHIGTRVILEAYRTCINYSFTRKNPTKTINQDIDKQANKKIRKNRQEEIWEKIVNWWADKAIRNECLYPSEVLQKLCLISNS